VQILVSFSREPVKQILICVSFVAGVIPGENKQPAKYQLFRSYRPTTHAAQPLLAGPKPENCPVPEVFAATGAAKFFLQPYTIGETTFFDETFPQSHPISSIALDEATGLYGPGLEISVLLNIGPGIPAENDCKELDLRSLGPISRLARRFSWPSGVTLSLKQKLLFTGTGQDGSSEKLSKVESPSATALELESERKGHIKARLEELYGPSGLERYHHLGPAYSPVHASLNDVHAIRLLRSESSHLKKQMKFEAESMVRRAWVSAAA
jgi:hypothetical protein